MEIGIRELKEHLSEVLRRANAGERITVTHHGRPLCEISPAETSPIKRPAYLTEGIQAGWLTPATAHKRRVATPIKPKKIGKTTTELLRESRTERF